METNSVSLIRDVTAEEANPLLGELHCARKNTITFYPKFCIWQEYWIVLHNDPVIFKILNPLYVNFVICYGARPNKQALFDVADRN